MVKYCISSKYSGTTCYDINPHESKNLKILTTILVVAVLIAIIIVLIDYLRDDSITKSSPFKTILAAIFVLFGIMIVYQMHVLSDKPVLCRGYIDCNKI